MEGRRRTSAAAAFPLVLGLFQALPVATCADSRPEPSDAENAVSVPEAFRAMEIQEVGLTNDRGESVVIETHVADDFEERSAGYQRVPAEVVDETAILFVFPGDLNGTFHMRNVEAPLDILFFDSAGGVVATFTMAPDPEKLWNPGQVYRYALEMAAGRAARLGLGLNSSLDFPLE